MKFEVDKQSEKTIFKIKEKELNYKIVPELKTELIFLQKEISNQFVLDLADVIACDSSGLSALLLSERMERDKKNKLILKNVNKKVSDLIKLARLDRIFELKQ
ncbi:MAG TPA: STAS domain-containing protein [Ignavibacteria bacterium]|nr:STAS domain-containing protein [Ignavibacteria bacterium]